MRTPTTDAGKLADFEAAVLHLVKNGVGDPKRILSTLVEREGEQWLVESFTEQIEELAEHHIRDLIRSNRQHAERKARAEATGSPHRKTKSATRTAVAERIVAVDEINQTGMDTAALADVLVYVPGKGNILYGDCTVADMKARARMYEKIAGANSKRAIWCYEVAGQMERENVGKLRDLATLPLLPNGDTPESSREAVAV